VKAHLELPAPHSDKQRLIMEAFSSKYTREIWVACGSKYGKSLSASTAVCSVAPVQKDTLWRWIAPRYLQTMIGRKYCQKMLPGPPFCEDTKRDYAPSLQFPGVGSQIQFFHGGEPEVLEGEAVHGYILDEAAKMKKEIMDSARGTTTFTRGKYLGISTPLGKNWFYKECMEAKEKMIADLKAGRPPKYYFITAPTASNPYIDQEAIAEAKARLPDRLFRQYFLAEFVDDGDVFTGTRQAAYGDQITLPGPFQVWEKEGAKDLEVCIGVDWAKTHDYTVFTAWAKNSVLGCPELVGFMRFHLTPYPEAVKQLILFSRRFKSVGRLVHDKTGVGEALDDMLSQTPLAYEGVTFNNANKCALVNTLILGIQRNEIRFPMIKELIDELDSYEVTVSAVGNMIYNAPSGGFDDVIMSSILGYTAAREFFMSGSTVVTSEDVGHADQWYADLMQTIRDDDDASNGLIIY
jgi:hypothetical protein